MDFISLVWRFYVKEW